MDEIKIQGVFLTPLNIIRNPKGDIYHGVKKSEFGFSKFGEVYFSTVNPGVIKGWNMHKKMTLNLIVPMGIVAFVIYDDRENSITKGGFYWVELSPENYCRLTVSPELWLAFKGKSNGKNLILNIADMEHNPSEIEKENLENIFYNWDMI
jgi:dTDP-4-dehydrorhamnose 3,5-epimerase